MQASRWATKSDNAQPPQPSQPEPAAQVAPEPAYDYDYPDASLDSFAQTAATDDLFYDDDFTPVSELVVEQTTVDVALQKPTPEPAPAVEPVSVPTAGIGRSRHSEPQHIPQGPANGERGRGGGRGRARGGRGRGRGGNTNTSTPSESRDSKNKDIRLEDKVEQEPKADAAPTTTTETETPPTPADPAAPKPAQSVRGDRTLTGGPKRSRLTEEQLNAKLASMRSKNDALIEAHARAEADSAEAEAREAAAAKQNAERKKLQAERQKVDRQNRQQMMGERERNRLRKLDAMGGREWDLEKEEGFNGTGEERRRGATRGAHGGVAPGRTPAPAPAKAEDVGAAGAEDPAPQSSHRERGRGRGRGARGGRGGGGGGGRGDHNGNSHNSHNPPTKKPDQQPPTAADFPTLPAKSDPKPTDAEPPKKLDFPISVKGKAAEIKTQDLEQRPGVKKQDSFGLPSPAVGSWADQVEGS